ncbi:MAG: hypothetical protein JXB06_03345 [Spirochaetales bacterium]|nr:hypothetical protein [Spirochaetales bacterium]
MLVYEENGSKAFGAFLKRTGLLSNGTFKLVLQSMINAILRARGKAGELLRVETRVLDDLLLPVRNRRSRAQGRGTTTRWTRCGTFQASKSMAVV